MKNILLILLSLALIMPSCSEEEIPAAKELKYTNLSYGSDAQQKYDIYLPEGRNHDTKLLIFVHGGGWSAGDKADFTAILATLEDNGFAIANINYRLANVLGGIIHPTPANDVRLAVDHLISKANEYKISSDNIILAGHSAGGHLALYTSLVLNSDQAIKGAISLAGPTDLEDDYYQSIPELSLLLWNYVGLLITDNPALYAEASPVNHVTAASVPLLLQYGELDVTVPFSNGLSMQDACIAAGAEHTFVNYPTYGHELGTGTLGLPDDVKNPILDFINQI
jgi:acetyl esterase/lipase